jgi:hypothetical protein
VRAWGLTPIAPHDLTYLDDVEADAEALVIQDGTTSISRLMNALNEPATDLLKHLELEEKAIGPAIYWSGTNGHMQVTEIEF